MSRTVFITLTFGERFHGIKKNTHHRRRCGYLYANELFTFREKTAHALYELKAWIENNGFPAHFPVEVRFAKGDYLMLSPSHGRDSCYINIIMYRLVFRVKIEQQIQLNKIVNPIPRRRL